MRCRANWFLLVVCLVLGNQVLTSLTAQDLSNEDLLRELEQKLDDGRTRHQTLEADVARVEAELFALRRSLISAAASARMREVEVSKLEDELSRLRDEEAIKVANLNATVRTIPYTLGALMRLSRRPKEAFALSPSVAVDTVRSFRLLVTVIPVLKKRADRLGVAAASLDKMRRNIILQQGELTDAVEALRREQELISRLLDRKSLVRKRVQKEALEAETKLEQLAGEAEDLRTLVKRLSDATSSLWSLGKTNYSERLPPSSAPFAKLKGELPPPVWGRLVRAYGEMSDLGVPRSGISIEAYSGAKVIASHDGHIVYAGVFRSYGRLLIIAHGGGYHTLLAGMDVIDSVVGQWVLAGEPIGRMSDREERPVLYVEVRREGEPVNPLAWLLEGYNEVRG